MGSRDFCPKEPTLSSISLFIFLRTALGAVSNFWGTFPIVFELKTYTHPICPTEGCQPWAPVERGHSATAVGQAPALKQGGVGEDSGWGVGLGPRGCFMWARGTLKVKGRGCREIQITSCLGQKPACVCVRARALRAHALHQPHHTNHTWANKSEARMRLSDTLHTFRCDRIVTQSARFQTRKLIHTSSLHSPVLSFPNPNPQDESGQDRL